MINFYKKATGIALCTLVSASSLYAQQAVTGIVTGTNGALSGVTVSVVGTNKMTQTNNDGRYSIQAKKGDKLKFTLLGHKTQEVEVNSNSLNITLSEDAGSLDEVVVTALGIKRAPKELGYAMSTVDAKELTKTGSPNFAGALYGKHQALEFQLHQVVQRRV